MKRATLLRSCRISAPTALSVFLLTVAGAAAGCGDAPPAASPTPAPVTPPPPPPPTVEAPKPAPPPAPAGDDKFAKVEIKVKNVAGNVYILQGEGGNIGALVGDDGIVIVDDEFLPLAPKIRTALKGISDKPIKFVVNTHWHGDHAGGNAAFGGEAPIVAQDNVRKRLSEGRPKFEVGGQTVDATPPAPSVALPVVTFENNVSIHIDGEDVRAEHFPNGHTDGDSVIFFAKANVVHMGDDFVTYGFPFVDVGSGGSVRGMAAAVDKVVTEVPASAKVIPGHGDVSTVEDLKKFAAMLKDAVRLVDAEVKKKKTLEQTKAGKPLAKYEAMASPFVSADAFVEQIYKELTAPPPAAKPAMAKPAAPPSPTPAH